MPDSTVGQTKKFGKGQRTVPKSEQKAQKWYPVDEEPQPKKVSTPLRDGYESRDVCPAMVSFDCSGHAVDRDASWIA